MLGPAVFPQVSNITERKKNSLRSSDPGKKQSFPCEQNEFCFQVSSSIRYAASSVLSVQNVKKAKKKERKKSLQGNGLLHRPGARAFAGAQSAAEAHGRGTARAAGEQLQLSLLILATAVSPFPQTQFTARVGREMPRPKTRNKNKPHL